MNLLLQLNLFPLKFWMFLCWCWNITLKNWCHLILCQNLQTNTQNFKRKFMFFENTVIWYVVSGLGNPDFSKRNVTFNEIFLREVLYNNLFIYIYLFIKKFDNIHLLSKILLQKTKQKVLINSAKPFNAFLIFFKWINSYKVFKLINAMKLHN